MEETELQPHDATRDNGPSPLSGQELSPTTILVMDVDSDQVAELCLLQLILSRAEVAACADDVGAAQRGFGEYVTVVSREGTARATTRCGVVVAPSAAAVRRVLAGCADASQLPHVVSLRVAAGSQVGLPQLRPWHRAEQRDPEVLLRDAGATSWTVLSIAAMAAPSGSQAADTVELQWRAVAEGGSLDNSVDATAMQAAALLAKLASSSTKGSGRQRLVAVKP